MNRTFHLIASVFVLILLTGCGTESDKKNSTDAQAGAAQPEKTGQAFITDDESTPNILQIAIGSEDHSTLVAAVQAANLENALVNAGPLMVFAPVNAAFDALPEGTVASLLEPENEDQLADILKYHVTPGNYDKEFLKNFKKLGQANGQDVAVRVEGEDVFIGEAKIIGTVKAGNGIIHVIDKVLLPPTK